MNSALDQSAVLPLTLKVPNMSRTGETSRIFMLGTFPNNMWFIYLGQIKKNHVSRPSAYHFWIAHQEKKLFFISLNLMYLALQLIVFRWKQIYFSFILIEIRLCPILRSTSTIEIHFTWYVENVELFLSQKSQFDLVEKIKNKIRNARAHQFFNLQRTGNKKKNLCGLIRPFW